MAKGCQRVQPSNARTCNPFRVVPGSPANLSIGILPGR